jgi:hypothetical protein
MEDRETSTIKLHPDGNITCKSHMKIKISYTLEDGHVGRNMYCKRVTTKCKTVTTNTIKLHADGNITCKTH